MWDKFWTGESRQILSTAQLAPSALESTGQDLVRLPGVGGYVQWTYSCFLFVWNFGEWQDRRVGWRVGPDRSHTGLQCTGYQRSCNVRGVSQGRWTSSGNGRM